MDSNNDGISGGSLNSCYHPQLHHQSTQPPSSIPSASLTNGVVVPSSTTSNSAMVYPHSTPSAASLPLESVKRKRGRPRKYGTPEQAAAAKRLSVMASPRKRGSGAAASGVASLSSVSSSYSLKQSQLSALGNTGQSFTTHIINVAAGEDVGQKVMMFMQQSKREICIISASGSVSNASLSQPAASGGSIAYEGRFDIVSLSGSYICTEHGGRTGGLSVCLSSSDGQIIGGGVGGPLTAASPIQVIVGTFLIDTKKDTKGENASGKLLSPPIGGGASVSGLNFRSPGDSPHHHQIGGESPFMAQHRSMQMTPSNSVDWRGNTSMPENGDYEHLQY